MYRFEEDEKIKKLKKGKRTDGVRFSSPKEIIQRMKQADR